MKSLLLICAALFVTASAQQRRDVSGRVITVQFEPVSGAAVYIETADGELSAVTDAEGRFSIVVAGEVTSLKVQGRNIQTVTRLLRPAEKTDDIQIRINYIVPPITATVTIQDEALAPEIELRNGSVYSDTLFSRDDQLMQTLNAGINAGQHEGGGKSLEIRRYGFNLDHGGVGGGLKILVDNIQQNHATQGHGQGYLGALKSLSPELVDDVTLINGPFSAAYGDFSGLGVVQIKLRDELAQAFTARAQGGSFNSYRGFFAYSPAWKRSSAFIAYEPSHADGPFVQPLRYRRHNITGNFAYKFSDMQTAGVKFNASTNGFFSSGQIPLDLVAAGELDRFGFIDPDNGGKVALGTGAAYYRRESSNGAVLRADVFVGRSLFDLWSNFTFFLTDTAFGDEIQQHDSRLQLGGNFQYVRPYKLFGSPSVITTGFHFHRNQINVGLFPTIGRAPSRKSVADNLANPDVLLTSARVRINNYGQYVQNETSLFNGHLRVQAGMRFDYFKFDVNGFELRDEQTDLNATASRGVAQPKLGVALSPLDRMPVTFYFNYGRGISSQDARGIAREPSGPTVATTDFYQAGVSYNARHVSTVFSTFLIDQSNQQVYIPDDGSVELADPSRSYGVEGRVSASLNRHLRLNAGLTKVIQAIFPGQFTADNRRIIVDSSPHLTANGGLVLSDYRGFTGSLNWRHISRYRLDGEDDRLRAAGFDVVDFAVTRQITRRWKLNFAIDNLLNKRYFETQNFFESRVCPTCDVMSRIHATPGYPFTITAGVSLQIGRKN